MAPQKNLSFTQLETHIGYSFKNSRLLEQAMTHQSALNIGDSSLQNYQRLEFLGDRVLGLVIATALLETFPHAEEGELAKRFNQLVRSETCADIAKTLGLGGYIRLGTGEERSGGREKITILADICEALIAALYLDGGYIIARDFILKHWQTRLENWEGPLRDAKTALQEWSHAQNYGTPTYEVITREGPDHAPSFVISVVLETNKILATQGKGQSKKEAQHEAATAMLKREGVWS